jgi:hypothetical protein
MTKTHIQLAGLVSLAILAAGLLLLIGYTFANAIGKATPDGKVPLADAGLFTAFLLSFQQTVGAIRSIWESQERRSQTDRPSRLITAKLIRQPACRKATSF